MQYTPLALLKSASTLHELAQLLNTQPKNLSYILYVGDRGTQYSTFTIPKSGGGERKIEAPGAKLKLVQKKLSELLQDCLEEIENKNQYKNKSSHGFVRGKTIFTNARKHRNKKYVFNADLKDFFPSINFGRVRGFFIKNADFELHPQIATIIAQIACNGESLPQGSPSSPIISNLIAGILDARLVKLAKKEGCIYTRYADDITFSTNKKKFPTNIARQKQYTPGSWVVGPKLDSIISRSGFTINDQKIRMQSAYARQEVTGLTVNKVVNIEKNYRKQARAMVENMTKTGECYKKIIRSDGQPPIIEKLSANQLHGILGFIDKADRLKHRPSKSMIPTYRKFLLYQDFYAAEKPTIVCEGKTDNVYLVHAIRSLAEKVPELATVSGNKIEINCRIYKQNNRSRTANIVGFHDGGASSLIRFMKTYIETSKKFSGPGLDKPIIVLYDNDQERSSVYQLCEKYIGRKPSPTDTYTKITKNLYIAPTPLQSGKKYSVIEDMFDDKTKKEKVDGKVLNPSNKTKSFDKDAHYGKTVFAYRVIEKKAHEINFNGFLPLLQAMCNIIKAHKKPTSSTTKPAIKTTP
jgi:retron-type reverse transcriptase